MRRLLAAALLLVPTCAAASSPDTPRLDLDDARRFARAFAAADGKPDAGALQRAYLDAGSTTLAGFAPEYIGGAVALAKAVDASPAAYRHAAEVCLPMFAGMEGFVREAQLRHAALVPDARAVEVVPLFGVGSSAGTVIAGRIVLGLEKVCDGIDDVEALRGRLRGLIAHEWVHTRQRDLEEADRRDLLVWALREGMANFLAAKALRGDPAGSDNAWAMAREAELWRQFQQDRATVRTHWPMGAEPDPQAVEAATRWMWNSATPGGRPADLGYWVGQRIAAAWFAAQPDKVLAVEALIGMRSPDTIVSGSGYAP